MVHCGIPRRLGGGHTADGWRMFHVREGKGKGGWRSRCVAPACFNLLRRGSSKPPRAGSVAGASDMYVTSGQERQNQNDHARLHDTRACYTSVPVLNRGQKRWRERHGWKDTSPRTAIPSRATGICASVTKELSYQRWQCRHTWWQAPGDHDLSTWCHIACRQLIKARLWEPSTIPAFAATALGET